MKDLNIFLYIANMTTEINKAVIMINDCENLEEAKLEASIAFGYVNSLIVMTNTLICKENNEITEHLSDLTDEFMSHIYQALCNVALKVKCDEAFIRYAKKRDEFLLNI